MSEEFEGGWNAEEGVYYAKGSFDNAVEYHNEIICNVNSNEQIFLEIINGMGNPEFLLDDSLAYWQQSILDGKVNIVDLGEYNGDDNLQKQALAFVDKMQGILDDFLALLKKSRELKGQNQEEISEGLKSFGLRIDGDFEALRNGFERFLEKYDNEGDEGFVPDNHGYTGMEQVDFDDSNPLLQPIHGVSLEDYAGAAVQLTKGVSADDIAKALGIELPQWEEANTMWIKRMQQDPEFVVAGLYGQYFATAPNNPKFAGLTSAYETNPENIKRLIEDESFFHELSGAVRASYEYGIDGSQWLLDNYGVTIGDFQAVAMQWANRPSYVEMLDYQEDMYKKYKDIFAAEQGGNVADDIDF